MTQNEVIGIYLVIVWRVFPQSGLNLNIVSVPLWLSSPDEDAALSRKTSSPTSVFVFAGAHLVWCERFFNIEYLCGLFSDKVLWKKSPHPLASVVNSTHWIYLFFTELFKCDDKMVLGRQKMHVLFCFVRRGIESTKKSYLILCVQWWEVRFHCNGTIYMMTKMPKWVM